MSWLPRLTPLYRYSILLVVISLFACVVVPCAAQEAKQVLALQSFLNSEQEKSVRECWKSVSKVEGARCAFSLGADPHVTLGSWHVTNEEVEQARGAFLKQLKEFDSVSFDVRLEVKESRGRMDYYFVPKSKQSVTGFHRRVHESLDYSYPTQRQIDLPGQWWPHLTLFSVPIDQDEHVRKELSELKEIKRLTISRLGLVTFGPIKVIQQLSLMTPEAAKALIRERYQKTSEMIPARDGVRLYTEIYAPREQSADLPIIFLRTPYRVTDPDGGFTRYFDSTFRELAKQGYIFAVQDARGRHGSEGKFEWNRPVRHRADPKEIDASTDAYDSIDWLVKNVKQNNSRVGMLGVSYPGWYVTMALIDPHPALHAASPQASPSDYFIGDDFYHFGAFRLGPSAELPYLFDFDPKENSRFPFDQVDTYEFFLDMGPLSNMNALYLHGVSPTWDHFMSHQTYDDYWKAGGTLQHLTEVTVPTLNVVGWWDAENLGGALDIYDKLEPLDKKNLNRIVVGPWAHGQWARGPRESLGAYDFGSDTVAYYQKEIEAPFFAHYLKDQGKMELTEATMFQTGSNQWQEFESWPPPVDANVRWPSKAVENESSQESDGLGRPSYGLGQLHFHSDGTLSFDPPKDVSEYVEYTADPAKPVPYSKRPIMGFWSGLKDSKEARFQRAGKLWKVEDQRFVHDRPDVVSFVTEPLESDVELAGRITAHLHASTSGTDSDWVVKLIDVYPESYPAKPEMGGYQLMIADDVLRGKFRNGFEAPEPVNPGEVNEYEINLRTRNHRFRKGHRIMVQIQSSWFPLIDRNPHKFMNIMKADEDHYQTARQRIYCSPEHPSHIEFSVKKQQ